MCHDSFICAMTYPQGADTGDDMRDGSHTQGKRTHGSHHELYFFVVDAHTTSLCPVLAGVNHRLELCGGSGYEYHVVDIEEGSNPVEVVNGGDLREFNEWEFGSQFEDKFRNTDAKEGRAKLAAFREAAENFHSSFWSMRARTRTLQEFSFRRC